jgi:hypothetical protein
MPNESALLLTRRTVPAPSALRTPHWFNFAMALATTVLLGFVEHALIKKCD